MSPPRLVAAFKFLLEASFLSACLILPGLLSMATENKLAGLTNVGLGEQKGKEISFNCSDVAKQ